MVRMTNVPTLKAARAFVAGCMLALTCAAQAMHGHAERGSFLPGTLCDSPQQSVQTFLLAVRREQLTLFHYTLDRSMLKPLRVEYVYDLGKAMPQIAVYSELTQPIGMPGNPGVEVRGVTAVLGHGGNIVETQAHAYAR